MTFRNGIHPAIAVKGKDASTETTLTSGNKPEEGDVILTFDNSPEIISVGDPVLCSDQDGNNNQYLGLVIIATTTTITVSLGVQETPATSLLIWVPTTFALFPWGTSIDQDTFGYLRGVRTEITAGNKVFPFKGSDASKTYSVRIDPSQTVDYASWFTFRETNDADDFTFSFGWWDQVFDTSRVATVNLLDNADSVRTGARGRTTHFGLRIFIADIDAYSE